MKLSSLARPPIQPNEVKGAMPAICIHHDGLIRHTGDVEGAVFFCPVGKEYWRYSRPGQPGMNTRLPYGREVMV